MTIRIYNRPFKTIRMLTHDTINHDVNESVSSAQSVAVLYISAKVFLQLKYENFCQQVW